MTTQRSIWWGLTPGSTLGLYDRSSHLGLSPPRATTSSIAYVLDQISPLIFKLILAIRELSGDVFFMISQLTRAKDGIVLIIGFTAAGYDYQDIRSSVPHYPNPFDPKIHCGSANYLHSISQRPLPQFHGCTVLSASGTVHLSALAALPSVEL